MTPGTPSQQLEPPDTPGRFRPLHGGGYGDDSVAFFNFGANASSNCKKSTVSSVNISDSFARGILLNNSATNVSIDANTVHLDRNPLLCKKPSDPCPKAS